MNRKEQQSAEKKQLQMQTKKMQQVIKNKGMVLKKEKSPLPSYITETPQTKINLSTKEIKKEIKKEQGRPQSGYMVELSKGSVAASTANAENQKDWETGTPQNGFMARAYFPQTGVPEYDWEAQNWQETQEKESTMPDEVSALRRKGVELFNTTYIMAPGNTLSDEERTHMGYVEEALRLLDNALQKRYTTDLLHIVQPPYADYTPYKRVDDLYKQVTEERLHHNDFAKGTIQAIGHGVDIIMAAKQAVLGSSDNMGKAMTFLQGLFNDPNMPNAGGVANWITDQMEVPQMTPKEAGLASEKAFFSAYPPYKYLITDEGLREPFIKLVEYEIEKVEKDNQYTAEEKFAIEELLAYIVELNRHAETEIPYAAKQLQELEKLWWYAMEARE